jgi:hypothetical protein
MYYALGALHHMGRQGQTYEAVELVVVQPRNEHRLGPVRRWRTSVDELTEWMEQELLPAIDRTREPDAPLNPGDHCRFCPAKTFCPALHELAKEALEVDNVKPLTDSELAEWMERKAALRHFIKAIDDETHHRLTQGNQVPGWKLVPKKANRTWVEGAEAKLRQALGDAVFTKPTLKSPAQVEKIKGGAELAKSLAFKPDSGLTAVKADDSRPGVRAQQAGDVFANY